VKYTIYIFSLFILLKPFFPVITYFIDYEHISNELCENIDKPKLRCDGKCYLINELANASEDEKPISDKKNQFKEIENLLFFQEISQLVITIFYKNNENNAWYNNLYQKLNSSKAFHPPAYFI
jgi:hypothetical protein